jgi:hypothetical protein
MLNQHSEIRNRIAAFCRLLLPTAYWSHELGRLHHGRRGLHRVRLTITNDISDQHRLGLLSK